MHNSLLALILDIYVELIWDFSVQYSKEGSIAYNETALNVKGKDILNITFLHTILLLTY